jgi:hypothetical protein
MDNIYKINVSGKIYDIKHKILKEIPYFLEFINSDESVCFVDRSSMLFDHVLAYVIDAKHPYPSKYFYELDFYGLIYEKIIYKVNVLGKIYYLKREILEKIPHFVNIINKTGNSSVELFVDRPSSLFDHVLAYVMNNDYPYPSEYYQELDFYGIIYKSYKLNNSVLQDIKQNLDNETYKIKEKIDGIENKINDIETKLDEMKDSNINKENPCQYNGCDNYINSNEDNLTYCNSHNECRYCCNHALRYYDYLCENHR